MQSFKKQRGIGALAVILAIVVVAVIVIILAVVMHRGTTKTTSTGSPPAVSSAKSVGDIKLSSQLNASKFTAAQLSQLSSGLNKAGTQYLNVTAGYNTASSSGPVLVTVWGPTVKKVEGTDLATWAQNVAKVGYSDGGSSATAQAGSLEKASIKGSDGAAYSLQCVAVSSSDNGDNVDSYICVGEVQKSSVLFEAEGSDAATAKSAVTSALAGSTAQLQ